MKFNVPSAIPNFPLRGEFGLRPSDLKQRVNFQSCAVVSNSGAMLHHQYGSEIDAHSAVFRFNSAPTVGFEPYVGKKEVVRVTNQRGWEFSGRKPFPHATYLWADRGEERLPDEVKRFGYTTRISTVPEIEWALRGLFASRWWQIGSDGEDWLPTTGCIGIMAALFLCDSVDIYEMYPSQKAQTSSYHYWQSANSTVGDKANDNSYHITFDAERALWGLISTTPSEEIYKTGRLTIPGFNSVDCTGVGQPQTIP